MSPTMRDKLSVSSAILRFFRAEPSLHILKKILNLPKRLRRYLLFGTDALIFLASTCFALSLRFEDMPAMTLMMSHATSLWLVVPVKFSVFYALGMYRPLLRHTGIEALWIALKSVIISEAVLVAVTSLLQVRGLPRSVQIISSLLTWIGVVGVRFSVRQCLTVAASTPQHTEKSQRSRSSRLSLLKSTPTSPIERIIIYGAGAAGFQLSQALWRETAYQVVAFVDDNPDIHQRSLDGTKIFCPSMLRTLIARYGITMVLLAVPSASPQEKRQIFQKLKGLPVKVKTVPAVREIVSGKVSIGQIRNVEISDLLGRDEVLPDPALLRVNVTDKVVLVTGAGGSIGSELCRQIAQQNPRLLVLYELNEFALYSINTELPEAYPELSHVAHLGSVTDAERLTEVFQKYGVQTVYHAAAYKHVPLVETNPAQGVLNNTYGTLVAARTADRCQVETFVLISTDKAVRPTNVMGATKRVAELVLQAFAADTQTYTRFVMVRFGNVLNSNGSVVPRFREQIAAGKPITLTHPEMTRYFMSIPEASRLVIQAGAMGEGGDVFLLDMGDPVKIYDLAVQMIELSGLIPGEDIEIEITGLRPGEKLYEELLIGNDAMATNHPKIFGAREAMIPWEELEPLLDQLFLSAYQNNPTKVRSLLQTLVPEYRPQSNQPASLARPQS